MLLVDVFKIYYIICALQCIGYLGILKKSREDSDMTTDGRKSTAETLQHTPEVRLLQLFQCVTLQETFYSVKSIQRQPFYLVL